MDREIIFRGKHIHALPRNEHLDGRWIEGYLADKNRINSTELEGEFLVDPETVCQYMGFTDKNGRKIFEGDILLYISRECPDDILRELVTWTGFSWAARKGKRDIVMTKWECEHMEVIGNIFDNPELLEE